MAQDYFRGDGPVLYIYTVYIYYFSRVAHLGYSRRLSQVNGKFLVRHFDAASDSQSVDASPFRTHPPAAVMERKSDFSIERILSGSCAAAAAAVGSQQRTILPEEIKVTQPDAEHSQHSAGHNSSRSNSSRSSNSSNSEIDEDDFRSIPSDLETGSVSGGAFSCVDPAAAATSWLHSGYGCPPFLSRGWFGHTIRPPFFTLQGFSSNNTHLSLFLSTFCFARRKNRYISRLRYKSQNKAAILAMNGYVILYIAFYLFLMLLNCCSSEAGRSEAPTTWSRPQTETSLQR